MNRRIGRNDPCPCGSGKKYKKCCFLKNEAVELKNMEYSQFHNTRMSAKGKLVETAECRMNISDSDILNFLSDSPIFNNKNIKQIFLMDEHALFFENILNVCKIFAYLVNEKNNFLWEHCLDNCRDLFDPYEIKYLESIKKYIAGFFQIKEIDSKNSITTFEDILTQKKYKIKDRGLSQKSSRHDILGGLLVPYNDIFVIEGPTPVFFSPRNKEYIRETVRLLYKMNGNRTKKANNEELSKFLNTSTVSIYRATVDNVLHIQEKLSSPAPELLTEDGRELIFLNTYYKISNRDEIKKQILKIRGFKIKKEDREKDEITWTNYKGTAFGSVHITDKELLFEANAREHLEKWKQLTKGIPLEFLKTEEMGQTLMQGLLESIEDELLSEKPDDISSEEFKKSAIEKWSFFYDAWFQEEFPLLNDESPAEAAKTKAGRQRVMDLIDNFENEASHAIKANGMDNKESLLKYFDVDELRKRLELL